MIYHRANTGNRKGIQRVISHKSNPNLGPDPDHPDRPVSHIRALSQQSPSLHCTRPCGDSRTSLCRCRLHPSSACLSGLPGLSQLGAAKIMGSPHTKTRRLQLPEWGGRVAVNITSSRLLAASIKLGHEKKNAVVRSSLFLDPITNTKKPSVSPVAAPADT